MSNPDRVKEELGNLRLFFAAFLAVDVSLIAWVAQTPQHVQDPIVIAAMAMSASLTMFLAFVFWRMHKLLAHLEKVIWHGRQ